MAELDPAVRHSTLSALKQSCPSAEFLDSSSSPPREMDNPYAEADAEWSDEEVLLPKNRRKTQYVPPQIKILRTAVAGESTSGSESPSPNHLSVNVSPLIPPKSPSRPDVRPGSSQDDLVQRFYQVTRERDALRKELQRQSMGAHGIPTRASVIYKSEERSLIEDLQNLRYEIRVWTEDYFSGPLTARARRPHMHTAKELFSSLADNHTTYLKHHEDRPLLMQAYIWSKLQQRIFSNLHKGCGYIWAGKLGDRKLRPINDTLRKGIFFPRSSLPQSTHHHLSAVKNEDQAQEYHQWRALTVNLLVPQIDGKWSPTFDAKPILRWMRKFSGRLRKRLRPWSTRSLRDGKEQLYTIISAAVALDLRMKKQRADYRFVTFTGGRQNQFWGYGFYDSEMEDIDEEEERRGRKVQMSLAPALERCGNANGHVFDQNFILVKADVTCKRLEKPRPPPGKKMGTRTSFWSNRGG
ncbi:hypothetical protein CC80DRAFT_498022 [Byssothecium circinans]|uniref:Uncharacterized protein n=1 Tax=Byssothecium circinans TaxID=147558 RepID=A0A6A5T928_9PLEO|nr:hypothetical protein CC80DRAFT_498022 [Byssothecium circinans]